MIVPTAVKTPRLLVMAWIAALLCVGCGRNAQGRGEDNQKTEDPQVQATLDNLTHQLRRAMPGHKFSGSFEEFTNACHIEAPPAPSGKKYAINKKWKVILVTAP